MPVAPVAEPLSAADRLELDRQSQRAVAVLPHGDAIARVVSGRQGNYPVRCYGAALDVLRRCDRSQHRPNYFLGIVGRLAEESPPPSGPGVTSSESRRTAPPTGQIDYNPLLRANMMAAVARRNAGRLPMPPLGQSQSQSQGQGQEVPHAAHR